MTEDEKREDYNFDQGSPDSTSLSVRTDESERSRESGQHVYNISKLLHAFASKWTVLWADDTWSSTSSRSESFTEEPSTLAYDRPHWLMPIHSGSLNLANPIFDDHFHVKNDHLIQFHVNDIFITFVTLGWISDLINFIKVLFLRDRVKIFRFFFIFVGSIFL